MITRQELKKAVDSMKKIRADFLNPKVQEFKGKNAPDRSYKRTK